MLILEILFTAGSVGAISAIAVFVVVYLLAAPGSEISFWGVRFYKRPRRSWKFSHFRPLPRSVPRHWRAVLGSFAAEDSDHLRDEDIYAYAVMSHGMTNMQAKEACQELITRGLIRPSGNYYALTSTSVKLVAKRQRESDSE